MADTIEKIRAHVLWSVSWQIEDLTRQANVYMEMHQRVGEFGIKRTWATLRAAQLGPKILWWTQIKTAIESNEPQHALSALERLIRHYRPEKFFLTWIGPLTQSYWQMGMGLIAKHEVSEHIREAATLQEYYRQQAA